MLVLSEEEVRRLLPMERCVEAMDRLFRDAGDGHAGNMSRYRLPIPGGTHQIMAGVVPAFGATGLKTYATGRPGGGPNMLVLLYRLGTGEPLALVSANALGAIRTGATSGVATRYMARPDAATVGVIGSGGQARTQLAALCVARKVRQAYVFSRTPERRAAFAREMESSLGIPVLPTETAEAAVQGADMVVTITNAREPVVSGDALLPGCHINAAGSNHWMRRELDETAIRRCETVVVDDLAQARIEAGDLIWAAERQAFRWERAVELRDVVAGRVPGRSGPEAITLFESQGLGMEDVAAAMEVYEQAVAQGMGREITL